MLDALNAIGVPLFLDPLSLGIYVFESLFLSLTHSHLSIENHELTPLFLILAQLVSLIFSSLINPSVCNDSPIADTTTLISCGCPLHHPTHGSPFTWTPSSPCLGSDTLSGPWHIYSCTHCMNKLAQSHLIAFGLN